MLGDHEKTPALYFSTDGGSASWGGNVPRSLATETTYRLSAEPGPCRNGGRNAFSGGDKDRTPPTTLGGEQHIYRYLY